MTHDYTEDQLVEQPAIGQFDALGWQTMLVNRELVLLYWHVGRDILQRQSRDGWGAKVIDRLSQDLRRAFPDMKGFSPRNLKTMRAFADAWPDVAIVQEVLAQLPWYHQIALLDKLRTAELQTSLPIIESIELALADEAAGDEA
jgi:hypothetical protein